MLRDSRLIARSAVFIRPNMRARGGELLERIGCDLDELASPVNGVGRTSVAGIWAAGNVANPRAQVITAAGEGSATAIAVNTDLVQEDAGVPS